MPCLSSGFQHSSFAQARNANRQALLVITPEQALVVGRLIWKNECGGTVAGLTSWNQSEAFPSLGIGHFLWYPRPNTDRFEESFPSLIAFLVDRGVAVPHWLQITRHCPWKNRRQFLAEQNTLRMRELRNLLANTVALQAEFIARRLTLALPRLLEAISNETEKQLIESRFRELFSTSEGLYALMDYVNFKGEGLKPSERYNGHGWGLLQVLQGMQGSPRAAEAVRQFAHSATRTLERRVANAPFDRRSAESSWLPAWKNRIRGYLNTRLP